MNASVIMIVVLCIVMYLCGLLTGDMIWNKGRLSGKFSKGFANIQKRNSDTFPPANKSQGNTTKKEKDKPKDFFN